MSAPQDEPVANPIVRTVMRYTDEAKNRKGMLVGMPKVTLDCSQVEYICKLATQPPAAVRAQAIAECLRIVRDEFVGDGGRLSDQTEGYNDAVHRIDKLLSDISPAPSVTQEWINKVIEDSDMKQALWIAGRAIRATLQSLGYEITP